MITRSLAHSFVCLRTLQMCQLCLRRENYATATKIKYEAKRDESIRCLVPEQKNTTHQIVVLRNGFDDDSALVGFFFQMHFFSVDLNHETNNEV